MRLSEEAAVTARRAATGDYGSIAIGFTATFGYGVLPDIVRGLRERSPGISLTLKEMVTSEQLDALDAGQLDVGLMRPHPPHGGLETVLLGREALMLAIPAQGCEEVARRADAFLPARAAVISYSPFEANYFYQLVQNHFDGEGVKPDIVHYVPQIHTMLALVDSGIGVALIPETGSRPHFGVRQEQVPSWWTMAIAPT